MLIACREVSSTADGGTAEVTDSILQRRFEAGETEIQCGFSPEGDWKCKCRRVALFGCPCNGGPAGVGDPQQCCPFIDRSPRRIVARPADECPVHVARAVPDVRVATGCRER